MIAAELPGFERVVLPSWRAGLARRAGIRKGRIPVDAKTLFEATVFPKDVVLRIRRPDLRQKPRLHERGAIKGFSPESRKRLKFIIRNTPDLWQGFLTLTYPRDFPMDGRLIKKQIHSFCTWLGKKKIAYIWVLEFQRRGAPHFHFLISGYLNKDIVKQKWFEIVDSGDPRHLDQGARLEAVKNPDEVGIYMAKYMGKLDSKEVPMGFEHVGRFWGASRCLKRVTFFTEGLYEESGRRMRSFRKYNQATRLEIAREQAQKAIRLTREAQKCGSKMEKAKLLIHARTAKRASLSYARRWRWRGYGFVLIRGANFFQSILKQAVMIDKGINVWQEYSKELCERRGPWVPSWMREHQLMLDGSVDPGFLPDQDYINEQLRLKAIEEIPGAKLFA